jgi:hypothetical protein
LRQDKPRDSKQSGRLVVIRSYSSTFSKNWSNTLTQRYSLKFYTPSKKSNYNISRYIIESQLSKAGIPLASNLGEFIQNNIKWLEAKLSKDCSRDPVAGPSYLKEVSFLR